MLRSLFTKAELTYLLGERRLARLATVGNDGMPHVVPVGWSYNPDRGSIDISGHHFAATQKFRNAHNNPRVAFVVDDVLPPFQPRCVMVQGTAQALDAERAGGSGGEAMIRVIPERITSWGLDSDP
jgi:PPOX class F420-dependent enzyme/OxyR family protein